MTQNINFEKICGTDRQKSTLPAFKKRKYKISHTQIPDIKLHNKFVENVI